MTKGKTVVTEDARERLQHAQPLECQGKVLGVQKTMQPKQPRNSHLISSFPYFTSQCQLGKMEEEKNLPVLADPVTRNNALLQIL